MSRCIPGPLERDGVSNSYFFGMNNAHYEKMQICSRVKKISDQILEMEII